MVKRVHLSICSKGTTECRHSNNRLGEKIAVLSHFSPRVEELTKRKKPAAFDFAPSTNRTSKNATSTNKDQDEAFGMDNYRSSVGNNSVLTVPDEAGFAGSGYGALAAAGHMNEIEKSEYIKAFN